MPIKLMVFENGNTGMVAICDVCGKRCADADEANVVWFPADGDDRTGDTFDVTITCKDTCSRKLMSHAEKSGHSNAYSQDLDAGLYFLLQNSGLLPLGGKKMRRAKGIAEMINSMSF